MADTHETFADIRKDAEAKFRELVEAYMQRRVAFQTTVGAMQAFNNVFDRLEAAHRREKAELREALVAIKALTESHAHELSELGTVYRTAKAFLKGGDNADE